MKKIVIKKKVVAVPVESVKAQFIPAIEMEEGVEYLNPGCTAILMLKSIKENTDPTFKGLRSLMCIPIEVTARHMHGGDPYTCSYTGLHPVLVPTEEELIRIKKGIETFNAKCATYRPKREVPIKTKVVINEKGERETVKVERTTRGDISPVTGYGTGTQGHAIGLIMIAGKCSPSTRSAIIPKITEYLMNEQGFEEKKAKSVGQSWYSTLWTRKANLYQKEWGKK